MFKNFLISDSFAQDAASSVAAAPDFSFASFVPLIAIFAIFYLLIIRPQSKKMKEHQDLIKSLKVGANVVTSGGFIGVVRKVTEGSDEIEVEIADNVVVKMMRNFVTDLTANEKQKIEKKQQDKKSKGKK